jgi:uncharacterized protein
VVFKRRDPRGWWQTAREYVYPRGGFRRAIKYVLHRMRRLPDPPHRIARGVFIGTFVNFPPLYGLQLLTAAALSWLTRGNILAAMLFTFLSNPITTPFIAVGSIELGHWILGIEQPLDFATVYAAFADAGHQLWLNISAIWGDHRAEWDKLEGFFDYIFWPYTVGSIIPGLIASTIAYYITLPAVHAYQRLRAKKAAERGEKRRAIRALLAEKARHMAEKAASESADKFETGGDDPPGAP